MKSVWEKRSEGRDDPVRECDPAKDYDGCEENDLQMPEDGANAFVRLDGGKRNDG